MFVLLSRFRYPIYFFFFASVLFGQQQPIKQNHSFAALEYSIGKTSTANVNFPKLHPQQGILFTVGTTNFDEKLEWARQLDYPETGFTVSYVDMGNPSQVGQAITVVPFIDFNLANRWNLKVGMGASYFNTIYDEENNINNKAITTHLNWAFRSNLYFKLLDKKDYNLKLGLGYFHNSNGHTRLPNNGLNTFLFSVYSELKFSKEPIADIKTDSISNNKTSQRYYSARVGLGKRVLSKYSTDKKDVYAFAASTGKIINKTFRYGYGFYYRFYEDYYDYITEDGALVNEFYPEFKEKPVLYSSNIGLFASGELLLSHVGIEFEIGLNLYKPAYKFDWQINEEKYVDGAFQLGELSWYYKVKKTISTRLGTKLYLINTNKAPRHNLFLGAFINANLGQADFSELTLGYVYCLPIKNRK